jgi:hypothetical protein
MRDIKSCEYVKMISLLAGETECLCILQQVRPDVWQLDLD